MKQKLEYKQKLIQSLQLSLSMKKSLDILKMSNGDLLDCINQIIDQNPIITYTPSTDMHLLLMETATIPSSLKDDIYLQLHTCNKTYSKMAADFVIESLDEHGFFKNDIQEAARFASCTVEEIQEALLLIKEFEPIGIASRDSIEAIALQLHKQYLYDAEYILLHEQEALSKNDYQTIAMNLHLSLDEIQSYIEDIRNCHPFPYIDTSIINENTIIPDFEILVSDSDIELIPRQLGHLFIENELESLKLNKDLKLYFDEAYYFIDSITKRNKTLLQMANVLIHIQKNHFLFHDELQPCTLMDISNACGFHESTVSRALSNKYYLFQNEVYPLKRLFVSATKNGSSKDSILKAIRKLVNNEDKHHPYADYELVDKLKELELYVSRRAIAKYRSQLHISSSKERKL